MNRNQIIDYYNQSEVDYRLVWHLGSQMALHYGFWDETTAESFERFLKEVGFKQVIAKDMTKEIMPSAKRLYTYFFPGFLIGVVLRALNFRSEVQNDNLRSAYYQYQTLKKHLWRYGVFYAQKK